ncbi:DUF3108 domain-containing protein [Dechloromonas sp. A34]|uniref:DUF3108 domain-containing protein n=1 Tax=Dechloromonas sp. A34 TaxID=447588 RepID=UPI0022494802|nr:DUF3108 domain-containing protein [Dechloromonas sp. A34]
MPIVLLVALVGSLAIHGVALFGTDVELFGGGPEPLPLQAEIQPPPPPPVPEAVRPAGKPPARPAKPGPLATAKPSPATVAEPVEVPVADVPEAAPETVAPPTLAVSEPAKPVLPASGVIRFAIYKESLGLQVGRAEHRWEFTEDGRYRLSGVTETSGLAALLRPARLEQESSGRLVAGGLQPERFRSLKNGKDANENADFDWASREVRLSRDGSLRPIAPGAQDILSLTYQLAYLGKLAEGSSLGVVTGKKYERYELDSLGEEEIEVPAGRFRTLHLRAMTDNVTEIWIALDRARLPVKIRFTDKKGESFEQVATELGMP